MNRNLHILIVHLLRRQMHIRDLERVVDAVQKELEPCLGLELEFGGYMLVKISRQCCLQFQPRAFVQLQHLVKLNVVDVIRKIIDSTKGTDLVQLVPAKYLYGLTFRAFVDLFDE
jgi:hypothetical protein